MHQTATPVQLRTSDMAVFADNRQDPGSNLVLVGRVEVPQYTEKSEDGRQLSRSEQYELAVHRALERNDTISVGPEEFGNDELMVLHDVSEPMEFVQVDGEPVDAWDPEK